MDKWLYRISVAFVVLGLLVSIYMTIYKVTSNDSMCLGSGDCSTVNSSRYSEVNGIPVGLIGVFGYLAILAVHYLEKISDSTNPKENPDDNNTDISNSAVPSDSATPKTNNDDTLTDNTVDNSDESTVGRGYFKQNGTLLVFGLALTGFIFTVWLIYVEFALLKAFCPFCVTSQVSMTIIFIISVIRLIKQPQS